MPLCLQTTNPLETSFNEQEFNCEGFLDVFFLILHCLSFLFYFAFLIPSLASFTKLQVFSNIIYM